MLIQFAVENYSSIKNRAVISFMASGDKSSEKYLIHSGGGMTLLPALAICGVNAAGKNQDSALIGINLRLLCQI